MLAAVAEAGRRIDAYRLGQMIQADAGFRRAYGKARLGGLLRFQPIYRRPEVMNPETLPWPVPALATSGALAEWLELGISELDWFADWQGRETKVAPGPLRHYRYQWVVGRRGKARLLEIPKARLKAIQRRLLHEILDKIPPHEAAHGFCRGRSIVSYANLHVSRRIVVRFDLRDFFPSIPASRVHTVYRSAGYPTAVARFLTSLCTNVTPDDALESAPSTVTVVSCNYYRGRHLPQGAPTSPALANLCAYKLDCRLAGLARSLGAVYTRYADDLAFSGDERLERCARRFQVAVCRIALEEGFEINTRKTRFMRQGVRQQLAGIVPNSRTNPARDEYDRLKAILHNCVHHGPSAQNRAKHSDFRAHLKGRIGYIGMLNENRGRRLLELFERIQWE
jgi:hypothetical protein